MFSIANILNENFFFSMIVMVLRTIVLDLLIGVILLERAVASTTTWFDFKTE